MRMATQERSVRNKTLLVMIHWLGGSSRTWQEVSEHLSDCGFRCVALDLPGFGEAKDGSGYSVSAIVATLIGTIRDLRRDEMDQPWLLAGHSMGGKLAAIVARAASDGEAGLENLRGVVLLSPSPPGPEPMEESKRSEMVQSLGPNSDDAETRRSHAEKFVDDNTGRLPLVDAVRSRAVDDVLCMNPAAFVAWLTTGSKEDRAQHVGRLDVPALVLAGTEEKALGPKAQGEHTLPHFSNAKLFALEGGGHLAPLERPWEIADRMAEFFDGLGLRPSSVGLGESMTALIDSDLTSPQTRRVLLQRLHEKPDAQGLLDVEELRTLRALAARVIPDAGFDLAGRLDQMLAQPQHDGWRFNTLPQDGDAWKLGLASLDAAAQRMFAVTFVALDVARQDQILKLAQKGHLGKGLLASMHLRGDAKLFDAAQMRDWFEDVRGELVKLYVADPRTMERIGFTGFADEQGFIKIGLSEREEAEI